MSVTAAVTVNVPAAAYVWLALTALTAGLPSPKLIVVLTILPSTSLDPVVDAVTSSDAAPLNGVTFSTATGGLFGIVTCTPADILFVIDGLPVAFTKTR